MGEIITIDNINFNYKFEAENEFVPEEENLGFNIMLFPPGMARTFLKECGHLERGEDGRYRTCFPHEDGYEAEDRLSILGGHECNSADTQIVFIHHFFSKKRRYNVDYRGSDIYWLFHDSRHARKDVYSYEVNSIDSHVEHERLIEGIELAHKHGHSMTGLTLFNLQEAWSGRFGYREGSGMQKFSVKDFYKYLSDMEKWKFDILELDGKSRIIPDWEYDDYKLQEEIDNEN